MYVIVKNGTIQQTIRPNRAFEYNGIRYNERWSQRMSREDKAALGIMEVVHGPRADERFAWVSPGAIRMVDGVPTQTYTATDKDLDTLKTGLIAQEKANANSALAATDWVVTRKAERDVAIPDDIATERQAILDACTEKEAAITAAETVDALIDAVAPGAVKASSIPVYEDPVEEVVEIQAEPEVIQEEVIEEVVVSGNAEEVISVAGNVDGNIEGNSDV